MDKIAKMNQDMGRISDMLSNFRFDVDFNFGLDELLDDFESQWGLKNNGNRGNRGRGASRGNRTRGGDNPNNNKQRKSVEHQLPQSKPIVEKLWEPVFDMLTMKQLFRYRLVCKGWQQLIDNVLSKRRSLKMTFIPRDIKPEVVNEAWNRYSTTVLESYIRSDGGIRDCYYVVYYYLYMKKMFPSITQLEVLFLFPFDATPFLKTWTSNLTSLTLREVSRSVSLDKLWLTLESLTSLRALHLLHLANFTIPNSIPILAQLEEFTLMGHKNDIVPILNGLNHDKLSRLSLDYVQCTSYQFYQVIQSSVGKFGCSISHLTIGDLYMPQGDESWSESNDHEMIILFAICLKSLTTLEILCSSKFKLGQLSLGLVKCKRLTTLRLVYRKQYVKSFSTYQLQTSLFAPLKSIRHLKLQFGYLSFDQFEQVVPIIFPCVKFIEVDCDDNDFKANLKKRFNLCGN